MSAVKDATATVAATNNDVSPRVVLLAGEYKNDAKIEEGSVSVNKDAFFKNLPEGVTKEMVESVAMARDEAVAALTLLTGEVAEEQLKKNKDLNSVTGTLGFGKRGDATASYTRSVVGRKSVTDPTEVTRYGSTQVRVRDFSSKPRGDLNKVRTMLKERAESLFK